MKGVQLQEIKMKQKFSTKWIGSKQPRKQKKYRLAAPLHARHKFVSAGLSKELRVKYGTKSFPVRKGDLVKIFVGKFKGKEGKINDVDLRKRKISIEGIQIQKKDGTKINIYIEPSNVQIKELALEDKERVKSLGKNKSGKKQEIKSQQADKLHKSQQADKLHAEDKNASEKK